MLNHFITNILDKNCKTMKKFVEFTVIALVDVPDDTKKTDIIDAAVKKVCNEDFIKDGYVAKKCKIFDS